MDKLDGVADRKFIQTIGVGLKNVAGRRTRSVGRSPGARQDFIHDQTLGIDPDHCQVHEYEQHVNGRVKATIAGLDQEETMLRIQPGAEHEAAQAAQETLTIFYLERGKQRFILI
jgi:hypothetical protein